MEDFSHNQNEAATALLLSNQRFQSKLSWKRSEAMKIRNQIANWIDDNFEIKLPQDFTKFEKMCEYYRHDERYSFLEQEYIETVKLYYTLGRYGLSVANHFTDKGENETFTRAHFYSKHKIDPVWNWRKSQLIRSKYRTYLLNSNVIQQKLHPVHITLTLPHKDGKYKGKTFYAKELIEQFNLIRKYPKWKQYTNGGEYGVEIKKSPTVENGLHIHIHSFTLLNPGVSVNNFRAWLQDTWERTTGATQIAVETLYFFKKDEKGEYITELKGIGSQTTEQADGTYLTSHKEFKQYRKKFLCRPGKKEN